MAPSFVSVAAFPSSIEAHAARAALEAAGIASFVDGDTAITALSHIGPALGGIQVRVAPEDAVSAREILQADHSPEEGKSCKPWNCPGCGELIEARFQVCWACGTSREGQSDPTFHSDRDSDVDCDPADEFTDFLSEPPGDAVEPDLVGGAGEDTPRTDDEQRDAVILRAWRAAVIGLALCPGLLHLYSILLLFQASGMPGMSNEQTRLRAFGAAAIDILVLSVITTFAILSCF